MAHPSPPTPHALSACARALCGDGHRLEAWLLLHALLLAGLWCHASVAVVALQLLCFASAAADAALRQAGSLYYKGRAATEPNYFGNDPSGAELPDAPDGTGPHLFWPQLSLEWPQFDPYWPALAAVASFAACLLALPLALTGGAHAVRMQSSLLSTLMVRSYNARGNARGIARGDVRGDARSGARGAHAVVFALDTHG